jgi:ATP-binding cassette subfamily C protein
MRRRRSSRPDPPADRGEVGAPGARGLVVARLRRVRALVRLTGWALVGALPTLASGQAVARAVDDGFLAGRTTVGLAWLGGLAATVPLGAFGARRTYLGVGKMVEPLRDDLVTRVVEGALRSSTGDGAVSSHAGAVARLTQHVEIVRDTAAGLLLLLLAFVAAVIAALAGLVALAPAVLPLVLVPLAASFGAFALSLPEVARRQRRVLLAEERVAELAGEAAGGLRDIVASGGEDTMRAELDEAIAEQVAAGKALARVAALRTVIVAIGGRVPLLLVLVAAGWLLDRGLSAGALLGTLTYLLQGLGPAVSSVVGGVGIPLAQLLVTVDRIDATVVVDAPPAGRARPACAALELRGVTFRYRTAAEPVIDGLDLDVAPGEHLAVVGPSGAGKSTLAALLVGMLAPQVGTIRHGGCPAVEVAASHRVLIPQQAYVFRGTVDENVRYLHPAATAAERDRAVDAVGLGPLVERLGGPDTPLDPGQLSAGERQLVSLARAYLSPAGLLVLDEATCHLDPAGEARVEEAFAARGDTLVVIAHRITSAERAQRILLLDGVEAMVGTHLDLIERSPLYRDLVGHWLDPTDPAAVDAVV